MPRQPRAEGGPCHAPGEGIHADTAEGPLDEEAGVVGSHGSAHQVHRQGDDGAHHVDEPQGAAARPVEQIGVNRPLSRHQAVGHEAVAPDVVPDVVARMPDRQGGRTREHGTHLPQGESDSSSTRGCAGPMPPGAVLASGIPWRGFMVLNSSISLRMMCIVAGLWGCAYHPDDFKRPVSDAETQSVSAVPLRHLFPRGAPVPDALRR